MNIFLILGLPLLLLTTHIRMFCSFRMTGLKKTGILFLKHYLLSLSHQINSLFINNLQKKKISLKKYFSNHKNIACFFLKRRI